MKRLAMILGSILVVSAVASAKEVVAKPVVIKEPVMVEEVKVEEPMAAAFRPSGYVGLEYRGYGNTEGHGDKTVLTPSGRPRPRDKWNNGENKYSRLQTTFGVQATEKFKLEGRIRDYNNLERNDGTRWDKKGGTDTRLRAYYDHSEMFTSRVEFRDNAKDEEKYEYQLRITPYRNEGGFVDMFTIAPKYAYTNHAVGEDYIYPSSGNYINTVGADFYLTGNLPLGFTWENNIYLDYNMHSNDFATEIDIINGRLEKEDKEFVTTGEFYLYNTVALYQAGAYRLDFNFEGGYDPYTMRQHDRVTGISITGVEMKGKKDYELYTLMDVSVTYSLSEALSMKTGAGAEYRNWDKTSQSSASDWRWQPVAYASMNVKF